MATYAVNDAAVARCRALIDARQYVLDSDWGTVQPGAEAQNAYLDRAIGPAGTPRGGRPAPGCRRGRRPE